MEILIVIVVIIVLIKIFSSSSNKTISPKNSSKPYNPSNTYKNPSTRNLTNIKKPTYQKSNSSKEKTYSQINAYKKWTSKEDVELKKLFLQGLTISDLAKKFGRNNGAITSRIKKLGIRNNQIQSPIIKHNYNFYLFHFTDPRNIPSIKKYGLLSWQELLNNNIIHYPASNELSRNLDRRCNLEDYVRLALNQNHPMFSAAIYYGRVNELMWLKISPSVIDFPDTLFSDDNATSNRVIINNIKNTALKSNSTQAEVLVKKRIDSKYILFENRNISVTPNNINLSSQYDDLPF